MTRGATDGLDLLAATVLRPGDRVGVEDPGYGKARIVLEGRGAELVPCPVDEHGLIVDGLPDDLRIIYTTPSHQYPMGGVLPVRRRQALLAWARRIGALIAEDDYDGEFRFDVAPLPALYGLDPDVVVYLGTTAKILTTDMGVGWLAGRPDLVGEVAARRAQLNDRTAIVPQDALRLLLERAISTGTSAGCAPSTRGAGRWSCGRWTAFTAWRHRRSASGGGRPGIEARRISAEAGERDVLVETLERHYMGAPRASGLVIGYGSAATTSELRKGCEIVRSLSA